MDALTQDLELAKTAMEVEHELEMGVLTYIQEQFIPETERRFHEVDADMEGLEQHKDVNTKVNQVVAPASPSRCSPHRI